MVALPFFFVLSCMTSMLAFLVMSCFVTYYLHVVYTLVGCKKSLELEVEMKYNWDLFWIEWNLSTKRVRK